MIQLKNITKKYQSKTIFNHFNLKIEENELVAIVGNSGSGKSTLLNIIGLLESIDDGEIIINNKIISSKKQILLLMRYDIGYMFQNNALIDDYTVEENLNIVLKYLNLNKRQKQTMINQTLLSVGLQGYEKRKIYSLSGGEAQRIAFSKLLLKKPKIVLCDEPTGSLDSTNTKIIMDLLLKYHSSGATVVIVTHDLNIANQCQRIIHI